MQPQSLPGSFVPSHGHGRLVPFQKGRSGNPNGHKPEHLALYHEAKAIFAQHTPQAAKRTIELMSCEDERVAFMACDKVLSFAPLKPEQADQLGQQRRVDLSALSAEERQTLAQLLQKALGL
ncbi:MAG TPA: hypothetical protein VKI44_16810 [Acetobacteraceae bacterium]|nr:hypothetical protein [Acetobacteraceae bacterium]